MASVSAAGSWEWPASPSPPMAANRSALPRRGSRSRNTSQATASPGRAATSSPTRQLKAAASPPPIATPRPVPARSITCWMENARPRRAGG
jgi:hypothetical protein